MRTARKVDAMNDDASNFKFTKIVRTLNSLAAVVSMTEFHLQLRSGTGKESHP